MYRVRMFFLFHHGTRLNSWCANKKCPFVGLTGRIFWLGFGGGNRNAMIAVACAGLDVGEDEKGKRGVPS